MSRTNADRDTEVLRKISQALYGGTDDKSIDNLRRSMSSYARSMEKSNPARRTHEAVNKWFRREVTGFPIEVTNYRFVYEYTRQSVRQLSNFPSSAHNASEILEKVLRSCSKQIRKANDQPQQREVNYNHKQKSLYIRQNLIDHLNNEAFFENAIGLYETIRQPSSENDRNILTREFIDIYMKDGQLIIDWHFRDKSTVDRFSGHHILTGDNSWFFLYNSKFKGRFRVLSSTDSFWKSKNSKFGKGLLLTQKPFHDTMQSAARRVLIHRIDSESRYTSNLDKQVRRIDDLNSIKDQNLINEIEAFLLSNDNFGVDV